MLGHVGAELTETCRDYDLPSYSHAQIEGVKSSVESMEVPKCQMGEVWGKLL